MSKRNDLKEALELLDAALIEAAMWRGSPHFKHKSPTDTSITDYIYTLIDHIYVYESGDNDFWYSPVPIVNNGTLKFLKPRHYKHCPLTNCGL